MSEKDYMEIKLRAQLTVLKDVVKDYSGRTIDNIVNNIEQRLKWYEQNKEVKEK